MNIIRLTKGQKTTAKVEHPLLDHSKPVTEAQLREIWGDKEAVILGHALFVKIIVGRFLANWPETRRFEDDMVSEGFTAVTEYVNSLKSDTPPPNFQSVCWTKIRVAIEIMLNRDRSFFAPPKCQQWTNVKEGKEPVYNYAKQVNEQLDGGESSYDPEFIDILDELSLLAETDRENLRMVILRCMEQDHGILESEVTQEEMDAIDSITRNITEM